MSDANQGIEDAYYEPCFSGIHFCGFLADQQEQPTTLHDFPLEVQTATRLFYLLKAEFAAAMDEPADLLVDLNVGHYMIGDDFPMTRQMLAPALERLAALIETESRS